MYRNNRFTTKAQTQIDFVIGVGIFLIAVSIVIAGSGMLLQPFTTGQENIVTADRVADRLTNTHLTTGDRQYVLDKDCTVVFFSSLRNNTSITPPDKCRFNQMSANTTLNDIFGVPSTYYVYITIENQTSIITMEGTKLAAGELPSTGTVTLSQRVVRINGQTYYAYVRVAR